MNPQEELEKFYQLFKDGHLEPAQEHDLIAGPDLITLDHEYLASTPRIAIIGKEQLGWDYTYTDFIRKVGVAEAISVYQTFDFGKHYYGSPFWRFFHEVRLSAFPEEPDARRKILWMNLLKFVATDASPIFCKPYAEKVYEIQKSFFVTELSIARPSICLFLTGPSYDFILTRYFPEIVFEPLELPARQFARLVHPALPKNSFRMYHPNYLNRDVRNRWSKVMEILAKELEWPSE